MNINVDKPIESLKEDILNRKSFVLNLVQNIVSYKEKDALTIGLYGKWGSGKTSIINLTTTELEKQKYKVINFNPWNFKGKDELLQCFFKELYIQLDMVNYHKFFTRLGNLFKKIGQIISFGKYVPVISPYATIIAPLVKEYGETLGNLTYDKSLEEIKNKISKNLLKLDKKLVIFIDDIDRLCDEEICQIFQLVKLVGNFENVIYVLSMDKEVVLTALQNSQKDHAETYLEKIIQLPLNIPEVSPVKVQSFLLENLNKECINLRDFLPSRNNDLIRTGFLQQFNNLRDVNRFLNVFSLKFESLKDNVDFHDFCIITLLEIKYPDIYKFIMNNKKNLCGNYFGFDNDDKSKEKIKNLIDSFLGKFKEKISDENFLFLKESLAFLFPKISQIDHIFWGYTTYHFQEAKIRGFIYIEENFDNYFQFNENELLYDKNQIEEIIETYDEKKFKQFVIDLNNGKQLSQFLYYLSYHIEYKLNNQRAEMIINWLFEISDNINKEDNEYNAFTIDCDRQIAYILINYLSKNRENVKVFEFLKNIYSSGNINLIKVELLRSLQFQNGRAPSDNGEQKKDPILSVDETIFIENVIRKQLQEFVINKDNFNKVGYVQYYYLMKTIDNEFCVNFAKETIDNNVNILNLKKIFVNMDSF